MSYTPQTIKSVANADILNYVVNNLNNYNASAKIPLLSSSGDNLRTIGAIIMDNPALQNQFADALVNEIAMRLVISKGYTSPLSIFKRGILEFGDAIEEIYVAMCKPKNFDPDESATKLFERVKPEIRANFVPLNYQKFYKVTVSPEQLQSAFMSIEQLGSFLNSITVQLYTAMAYDEEQVIKYLLCYHAAKGNLPQENIYHASPDTSTLKSDCAKIRASKTKMQYMSPDYNIAGVMNHSEGNDIYIMMDADTDAKYDVEVLASAFNMPYADFLQKKVVVNSFYPDVDRLDLLFAGDSAYSKATITGAESQLKNLGMVVVSREFFQIWDRKIQMTDCFNSEGLYRNYTLHNWKSVGVSPFAPVKLFNANSITYNAITAKHGTSASAAVTGTSVTDGTPIAGVGTAGFTKYIAFFPSVTATGDQELVLETPDTGFTVTRVENTTGTNAIIYKVVAAAGTYTNTGFGVHYRGDSSVDFDVQFKSAT